MASIPPSSVNWKGTASSTFWRMASNGAVSATDMTTPYARARTRLWLAGALAGAGYGAFLIVAAARLPTGADPTGQFVGQPAAKALMAVLLAGAACAHPIVRERRWLVGALLSSAAGDFLLAMPWWEPSFVLGLAAFLLAHLCYLAALVPLVSPTRPRMIGISEFVRHDQLLAVPIWWAYAVSQVLITAGLFVGRGRRESRRSD